MGLAVTVESRTGDTPQAKRARQRRSPPNMFLTTPESLMLMLSSPDAERLFSGMRAVIVDEVHSFAVNEARGFHSAGAVAAVGARAAACANRPFSDRRRSGGARGLARANGRARACAIRPADEARHSHS